MTARLHWSALKEIATSPLLCRLREQQPREDTAALALGRAIHCAILEPARWQRDYACQPEFGDGRTSAAKAAKAAWTAGLAPGVEILAADAHATAERCATAVRAHRVARELLAGCRSEEVVEWTDPGTVTPCAGRLDAIRQTGLVDLKSTRHGTVREILRDATARLYHGQLAWYHDGAIAAGRLATDAEAPHLIAVQTAAPWDVMCCRVSASTLAAGRELYRALLARYRECQAADLWPGIAPDLLEWELPPWALGAAPDVGGDL